MIHSPPEVVFHRAYAYRVAVLMLAALILITLFFFRELIDPRWLWSLAAGVALLAALFWGLEAKRSLGIHSEGLVVCSGAAARAILWESIHEVRYRAVQATGGGLPGFLLLNVIRWFRGTRPGGVDEALVNIRCALKVERERPFILTSAWNGAGRAVEIIQERVGKRLLRQSMERLLSQGTVGFGPVTLTTDSIAGGRKKILFAEVAACGLEAGRFFVKKQDSWGKAIQIPVWRIPNVFVLVRLLQELDVPGIQGVDLSSATQTA